MKVLALDTSSPYTSCALCEVRLGEPAQVLAESLFEPPQKAGDLLPAALAALCAQAGLGSGLQEVQGLAVGIGPGSFTGLRVGLAAMKTLAYALRLPLAGVSSLAALALSARVEPSRLIAPTLEARRGELYASLLRGAEILWPEAVYQAAAFADRVRTLDQPGDPGPPLIVGPGARANAALLGDLALGLSAPNAQTGPRGPLAWAIAQLCASQLEGADYDAARCFALAPNYLQESRAEVALREGRVGGLRGAKLA